MTPGLHFQRDRSSDEPVRRNVSPRRRGYTLIELLVVVAILVLLLAVVLPIATVSVKDTRLRTAGSRLQSVFQIARQSAIRDRVHYGVYLQVDQQLGNPGVFQVTKGFYAKEAAPYCGATSTSRAYVDNSLTSGDQLVFLVTDSMNTTNPTNVLEATLLRSLVLPGEAFFVRFDYKGEWFTFQIDSGDGFVKYLGPQLSTSSATPPTAATGLPFQILRKPQRTGEAFELPQGVAIDLAHSGLGLAGLQFNSAYSATDTTSSAVVIMYSPSGSVDQFYVDSATPIPRTLSPNFLVGEIDRVGVAGPDSNISNPGSLWLQLRGPLGIPVLYENVPEGATNMAEYRRLMNTAE